MDRDAFPDWQQTSAELVLPEDEVHIWKIDLDTDYGAIQDMAELLSPDERARSNRFKPEHKRNQYILTHGFLRKLLGNYLQQNPATLQFSTNSSGKPCLINLVNMASLDNPYRINFNISHSRDISLIAVARNREIGIDVESLQPKNDLLQIARRYFSSEEVEWLAAKPALELNAAFYRIWTAKEAYLKAVGTGLSGGLNSFTVRSNSTGLSRIEMRSNGDASISESCKEMTLIDPKDWFIRSFYVIEGYIGAVAINNPDTAFRFWCV